MKKFRVFLLIVALFTLFSVKNTFAQEISAKVTVNMESIPEDERYFINSMQSDVENYLSSQRFTDIKWEGPPIPVDVTIVITGGSNHRYSAQLLIASRRYIYGQEGGTSITMKLIDKDWSFEYNQGAMLSYNTSRFNEFTSLLDYYMLLVIGFDSDTYGELDGTKIYDMAKNVCMLGATAGAPGYKTFIKPGEYSRYSLVSELTDMRFDPLRKLIFSYYVDGLDMMAQDRDKGLDNLAYVIHKMADFKENKLTNPSVILNSFFDAKALELAETFKGKQKYLGVYKDLIYLDPSNTSVYQDAAEGR